MVAMLMTSRSFPRKYAARGIGVPARRLSAPLSRSIEMPIARAWKPLLTNPLAIIPATKYWLNVTPGAMSSSNTEPKMNSSSTGNKIVNTTDSRRRMNCLSSIRQRWTPTLCQLG